MHYSVKVVHNSLKAWYFKYFQVKEHLKYASKFEGMRHLQLPGRGWAHAAEDADVAAQLLHEVEEALALAHFAGIALPHLQVCQDT